MEEQPYLTAKEVARRLNVPLTEVWHLIRTKQLPAHKIGREYRVAPGDLLIFLKRTRTTEAGNDLIKIGA